MIKDKSVVRVVSSLNIKTKSGELKWTPRNISADWYIDNASEKIVNPVYDTKYENKFLRLFKYTYRYYTDEDSYVMTTSTKLCFIDLQGFLA